jgi:hypothetical protein
VARKLLFRDAWRSRSSTRCWSARFGLRIEHAVATSLMVIALNGAAGLQRALAAALVVVGLGMLADVPAALGA